MSDQYQGEDFAAYIERERAALTEKRENAQHELAQWQHRIDMIDTEFAAIDAYDRAKKGKWSEGNGARILAGLRDAVSHAKRARRGDVSESVMSVIAAGPARRVDIINTLGVKGDEARVMSVSNALTRLKGQGRITRREDGHWAINEAAFQAAAE